jgi:hypothetical protein
MGGMNEFDRALIDLAERQHGLVARRQADTAGGTRLMWHNRIERGDWEVLTERVVRRRGSAPTAHQRALAGVLDAGPDALISHESAAALWGVAGFGLEPVHVLTRRARAVRSPFAELHLPRHETEPYATAIDGLPVVRPALLLLQLAAIVPPARLQRIFDSP